MIRKLSSPMYRYLWDAELKIFSQWGEDGIIDYLCESLNIIKPKMLEFGVGNFTECNSRFLVENRNASVVVVDSDENLRKNILGLDLNWRSTVIPVETWITPSNCQEIYNFAKDKIGTLDIISIDLDGCDYWIADKLNFDEVQIIIVEYNPVFGSTASISVPMREDFLRTQAHYSNLYYGASLMAWIKLFSKKGFTFVGTNRAGSNAFFVQKEKSSQLNFDLPSLTDLDLFCDWRVRESRDPEGNLSLLDRTQCWELIKNLPFEAV